MDDRMAVWVTSTQSYGRSYGSVSYIHNLMDDRMAVWVTSTHTQSLPIITAVCEFGSTLVVVFSIQTRVKFW